MYVWPMKTLDKNWNLSCEWIKTYDMVQVWIYSMKVWTHVAWVCKNKNVWYKLYTTLDTKMHLKH